MTTATKPRPTRLKKPQPNKKPANTSPKNGSKAIDQLQPVNGRAVVEPVFDFSKDPGYYNATAKKAILRRGKRPPYDELIVDFSNRTVQIELRAAGNLLLAGTWDWSAAAGGKALAAEGEWKEVSWHRERSCDYLEIELPLSDEFRLERQMFFARDELIFLVADCLIGPESTGHEINYSQMLPLAEDALFSAADDTCEGWLTKKGRRMARVLPLAQPEWRSDFRHARLTTTANKLVAEQAAHGRRLLSPLWIDLHPRRIRRPITWRQLTVGENLTALNRDVATGYRIQSGNEQWLVYRSLAPVANRSVLGHNTYGSFVCGRIQPDGNVKEILTME